MFRGLCSSPGRQVAILARLLARDIRSTTGRNIMLFSNQSGCGSWEDTDVSIRARLKLFMLISRTDGVSEITAGAETNLTLQGRTSYGRYVDGAAT